MQKNNKSKQQQETWESKYHQWQSRWMGVSRCQDSGASCSLRFNKVCVLCAAVAKALRPHGLRGFSVHGIFQARIPEWVAMPSSRGPSRPRDWPCIFRMGRWILYHWATWEAHILITKLWIPVNQFHLVCQFRQLFNFSVVASPAQVDKNNAYFRVILRIKWDNIWKRA